MLSKTSIMPVEYRMIKANYNNNISSIFLASQLLVWLFSLIIYIETNLISPVIFFLVYSFFLIIFNRPHLILFFSVACFKMLLIYYYWIDVSGIPYYAGAYSDDYFYDVVWSTGYVERFGWSYFGVKDFLNDISPNLGTLNNSNGYVYFVAVQQGISEIIDSYHTLTARITNIFLLTLIGVYAEKIYKKINGKGVAWIVSACIIFFPTLLFNSSHVFRDTLTAFVLVVFVEGLLLNQGQLNKIKLLFVSVSCIVIMSTLRFQMIIPMAIIFAFSIYQYNRYSRNIVYRVFLILMALLFFIAVIWYLFDSRLAAFALDYSIHNEERMGGLGSKIYSLPLLLGVIPRILFLVYTPSPNIESAHQIYLLISTLIQIFAVPIVLLGMRFKGQDAILLVAFITLFLSVAFSTATFRHVNMYLPFAIVLVVNYMNSFQKFPRGEYIKKLILFIFVSLVGFLIATLA